MNKEGKTTKSEFKRNFLKKLNMIKEELYGEKSHPFSIRQLNYHVFSSNNPERYIQFQIPKKKKGEFRTITAPNPGLKSIQHCINVLLQESFTPHAAAFGFVANKSIVENAWMHVGQNFIYNIDLKDFFPSVKAGRVFACLQLPPFSFDKETASFITDLCCHEGRLPQGAPTSPVLTNIVCYRLDWRLAKLAKRYGLKYTRYADDITFSGMNNVFHEDGQFVKELNGFIEKEGFVINGDKTRLCTFCQRQEVTGLTINEKPNVSQKYIKQIRTMLQNWEKGGYDYAQALFICHYHPTKHVAGEHHIENILRGKLDYLKMVKGEKDSTYIKLSERYGRLVKGLEADVDLNKIIQIWEQKGVDLAKKSFEKMTNESHLSTEDFVNKLLKAPSSSTEAKKKIVSLLVQPSFISRASSQSVSADQEKQDLLKKNKGLYHDPEFVSRFLHQFTEKECEALKFTTHYWDKNPETGDYNYKSFDELKGRYKEILQCKDKQLDNYTSIYPVILSKFGNRSKEGQSLMSILLFRCEHLWKIINNFLLVDDPCKNNEPWKYQWGEHKLRMGYNIYLKDWMDKNPGKQPFFMPLSDLPEGLVPQAPINGKTLSSFGDVVNIFKYAIQFRDNDLFFDVEDIFRSSDIRINREMMSSLKGKSIFTDTALVKEALKIIKGNIVQRPLYPDVEIRCSVDKDEKKETVTLRITQVGSFSNKDINDSSVSPIAGEGSLFTIKSILKNLCDFSVESNFSVDGVIKPLRINYLSTNYDNYLETEDLQEECKGFSYILRFYNYNKINRTILK